MSLYEPITLTPHWGDRARDLFWKAPTAFGLALMFAGSCGFFALALAVI